MLMYQQGVHNINCGMYSNTVDRPQIQFFKMKISTQKRTKKKPRKPTGFQNWTLICIAVQERWLSDSRQQEKRQELSLMADQKVNMQRSMLQDWTAQLMKLLSPTNQADQSIESRMRKHFIQCRRGSVCCLEKWHLQETTQIKILLLLISLE